MSKYFSLLVFGILLNLGVLNAQDQGSNQIRIEDVCKVSAARLQALTNSPLYAKALAAKKQGKLLPMQADRLRAVENYKSLQRFGKCSQKK